MDAIKPEISSALYYPVAKQDLGIQRMNYKVVCMNLETDLPPLWSSDDFSAREHCHQALLKTWLSLRQRGTKISGVWIYFCTLKYLSLQIEIICCNSAGCQTEPVPHESYCWSLCGCGCPSQQLCNETWWSKSSLNYALLPSNCGGLKFMLF